MTLPASLVEAGVAVASSKSDLAAAACDRLEAGRTECDAWPPVSYAASELRYPPDCPSPAAASKERRAKIGSSLLCTISGWVWLMLGSFSLLAVMCSLLMVLGSHASPGSLGAMLLHHGTLGRRSVLGRALPTLTWCAFELGAAGSLYLACLTVPRLVGICGQCLAEHAHTSHSAPLAGGGVDLPFKRKLRSIAISILALLIAFTEMRYNDMPVLWQHLPLAVVLGCAFSCSLLAWYAHLGAFVYLYADTPRTSAYSALLAALATPIALTLSFAAVAALSSSWRVRNG